ncbi:hypothetical protein MKEN_00137000 [Mycena kentingensis (nom. inval.)]|nr:hypothetical protein MKEN_00137000 [Mycena kentingensis (nom. inval.)]
MLFTALLLALVPTVLAKNFAVQLGVGGARTFTPNTVMAVPGDTITFTVVSANHSSTATRFSGAVCPPPPGGAAGGPNGWDSGFMSDLDGSMPSFTYTVVDTKPHFAACMQANGAHCRAGMVFALNPNSTMTLAQFRANAAAS